MSTPPSKITDAQSELEWIKFREETLGDYAFEKPSTTQRIFGPFRDNPFVALGTILTVCALGRGLLAFKQGDSRRSQLMMRGRVAAQGFTIIALVVGVGFSAASRVKPTVITPE